MLESFLAGVARGPGFEPRCCHLNEIGYLLTKILYKGCKILKTTKSNPYQPWYKTKIGTPLSMHHTLNLLCYTPRKRSLGFIYRNHPVCLSVRPSVLSRVNLTLTITFYAPGLKGPPGASSNQIVRLSVCLSVCPSVCNSVLLTNKVQYFKFGWSYSNQTWTVSSYMGSSHFTDITCPWGWGGAKM